MNQRERCLATKRDGSPCRRYQAYPDGLCIQHHRLADKRAQDALRRATGCHYCAPDEPCALHTPSL